MKFPIGAMSVGDILDRGLKITLARLPTFYVINLIVLLPILLFEVLVPTMFVPTRNASFGASSGLGLGVVVIFTILLSQIGTAASLHVVSQEFVDRHVGMEAAFTFALSRFGSLLLASILVGLIVGGVFVLVGILAGFLIGMLTVAMGPLGLIVGAAITIAIVIPVIGFLIGYLLVSQVVVVEGCGAVASLERSKTLADGYRWRIVGILVLLAIINALFQLAGNAVSLVLPYTESVEGLFGMAQVYNGNYVNYVIHAVVVFLLNVLTQIYYAVCLTLLYFDLRIRKEGLDLELAAQEQTPS